MPHRTLLYCRSNRSHRQQRRNIVVEKTTKWTRDVVLTTANTNVRVGEMVGYYGSESRSRNTWVLCRNCRSKKRTAKNRYVKDAQPEQRGRDKQLQSSLIRQVVMGESPGSLGSKASFLSSFRSGTYHNIDFFGNDTKITIYVSSWITHHDGRRGRNSFLKDGRSNYQRQSR